MKKYQLGGLSVSDKELQDTKQEIIIELIDQIQKYVAKGKEIYGSQKFTDEEKLENIKWLCGRLCGLSDFLTITMGVEVRNKNGQLFTQEMYNYFFYWKQMLNIRISKET